MLLLLLAVVLQFATSLARYGNGLFAGWFAASCQGRIILTLHYHLLSLSFYCLSRFCVGHLVNVLGKTPLAVQSQIMEWEQVLSNGVLVLVYLIALFVLSPLLSLVAISMAFAIVSLLVGLYIPSSGAILIDGIDLEQIDLDHWQRLLGVMSQDVQLLNGSIAANISFGLPDPSSETIAEAARLADAEPFILNLPEGYDTVVGERGFRLSGGQRQRLSLVRALLRRPQLLILDEATSPLVSLSEARILDTISHISSGLTVLSVAHRLSSIREADKFMVLEQGRLVERGGHGELMALDGLYAVLWRRQASERFSPEAFL